MAWRLVPIAVDGLHYQTNYIDMGLYLTPKTRRRTHVFYASAGSFSLSIGVNSLRSDSTSNTKLKLRHHCRKREPAPSVFLSKV